VIDHGSAFLNSPAFFYPVLEMREGTSCEENTVNGGTAGIDTMGSGLRTVPNNLVIENVVRTNGRFGIWSQANETRLQGTWWSIVGSHGIEIGNGAWARATTLRQTIASKRRCGVNFENLTPYLSQQHGAHQHRTGISTGLPNTTRAATFCSPVLEDT